MVKLDARGFTLIEVAIGAILGGLVSLVAFYLMYFFNLQYTAIQNKIEVERGLIQAVFNLQRNLALAVELDRVVGPIPSGTVIAPGARGRLSQYVGTSMAGSPGAIDTLGLFLREKGGYQPIGARQGEYTPTGIFYVRPTPTRSGAVFLDVSDSAVKLPDFGDVFFDRVVEFSIQDFTLSPNIPPTGARPTSAEIRITMRNFLEPESATRRWNFCPKADVGVVTGCSGGNFISSRDYTRSIRVTFSNQIIRNSSPSTPASPTSPFERTFGQLYLFPMVF